MSLKIHLLGQFKLQANHLPLELPSRPAQSLLAYLALNAGVRYRREKLASLLWPEATETNARGYLRRVLWQMRKSLTSESLAWEDYLQISDIEVAFNDQSDYWLDADLLLARAEVTPVDELIEIVRLYHGELLPGFYDQWTVLERERLLLAYHQKMNLLMERLIQDGQWGEALKWGEQWIRLTYSPEPAYRALMIAHAGLGDQGMVSATYQHCMEALNRDLGLEPSPETRHLFQQLVSGETLPTISGLPEPVTIAIQEELPAPGSPPYKGLEYFDVGDADLFFGREKLTAHLAGRLREGERLLFVVGASGSGKSSLVRAGLIPALKRGEPLFDGSNPPEGSPDWLLHVIQPTAQPLETLATSLCHDEPYPPSVAALIDDLHQDPRTLHLCARRLCQAQDAPRLLLVVDQFEELFTLCQDEGERTAFIANLLTAVDPDSAGPTTVVVTLRADFYAHCAQYPQLRQQLAKHQEYIGPMSSEELRQAIEEPARQGAWEFEPGLVDLILRDVRGQPGSLPLLSHALLETWRRRRGRILTLKSYAESGSVHGAIARTAETIYQQGLNDAQQAIARQIFLRLTELGEDAPETRRRAQTSELLPSIDQRPEVKAVLEKLVAARLVTVSEDYAEVSHEALIREWPTLRGWLEEDRQGFMLHRQLTEAALTWESMERDESILYRGARLASALEWSQEHQDEVNILEREFLEASRDLAEQRQRERERQLRRRFWLASGLAGTLLVAILIAFYAFNQRSLAQRETTLATSRQLAAAALNNLESDPELGILLALEAVAEAQGARLPVPKEAQEALHQSLQASQLEMVIDAHPGGVRDLDYSPDGERIVSVGKDRTLKVWDARTGQLLDSTRATNVYSTHVTHSPDGKYLVTADHDMTAKIWDSQTLTQIDSLIGHPSGVYVLAFSPDGERLVTSDNSPWESLFVWDIATRQVIETLFRGYFPVPVGISFSPDGKWIAAAGVDGMVRLWDATTYEEMHRFGSGEAMMFGLAFSPDGSLLVASDADGKVTIWDFSSWEELLSFYAHADWIVDIEFSPDGDRLATSSLDGTAKIWDISTGQELLQLSGHTDGILSVAFDPRGEHLATASQDGTIRLWNISLSREWLSFPTDGYAGRIAFSPDGSLMAAGAGPNGGIHLWDLDTRDEAVIFFGDGHPGGVEAVSFSPDSSQLASVGVDDCLRIWDAESGQLINVKEELEIGIIHDVVYSPDGSLLAIGGENLSFALLDAATLEKSSGLSGDTVIDGLAFSPDGSQLASTSRLGMVNLWDARTGKEIQSIGEPAQGVTDVAYNPDGTNLALASLDSTVSIWQLEDEKLQLTLRGHSASVTGVAYSPDGSRLATASQGGSARLWDATTGQELLLLKPEDGAGLVDVAFSPDGKYLVTSGQDALRVFLLDINDLVELAERRLSRDLTPQECQRFLPAPKCESLASPISTPHPTGALEVDGRICLFTYESGISKFNFLYQVYLGIKEAARKHDWDMNVFVPEPVDTYSQEFQRTIDADCNLIVSGGFLIKDVVEVNANQHPNQRFLSLDVFLDPPLENVRTVTYATDQGAFLAGYLAAAMTETGAIGTFGGAKEPSVTDFMDGFEAGMRYYNQKYHADVKLLGWDSATYEGYILGDFLDPESGRKFTERLLDQGADIILPVAGQQPGLGALQAVAEVGDSYAIGVDVDYADLFPQFADVILTSVEKRYDLSVIRAADALAQGNFKGGNHLGTLESGEVALALFYELEYIIPAHIKADLEQIKADIIAGKIQTKPEE
jgi:WD40 repeat protein/basic membrane lipoprotein Med (substrate-binding protein (PBP1-ABC) superfamily)/DNA-binding SARP family transcriptional activator/energy-coupling factor transporter ATP-binding protein EcfA2